METVYDIHQFTSFVVFYYTHNKIRFAACNNISRFSPNLSDDGDDDDERERSEEDKEHCDLEDDDQYITEDEDQYATEDESYRPSNSITDNLYDLFKKDKEKWDDDDICYLEDIVNLIGEAVPIQSGNKSAEHWHYAIVVPSSWEEKIRDEFIRPLFIRANLISKEDHKDRLLFFSEIECIFYYLQDKYIFQKEVQTFTSKIDVLPNNDVLIRLDLVQTINPLFTFSDSKLFPKVLKSDSFSITPQDFKNDIRLSLTNSMISSDTGADSNHFEESAVDVLYSRMGFKTEESDKKSSKSEESKILEDYEDTEAIFGLCDRIKTKIRDLMNSMLSNSTGKRYETLTVQDLYSFDSHRNVGLANWVNSIQNDSITFVSSEKPSSSTEDNIFYFLPNNIFHAAFFAAFETIKNGDIYCPPRIIDKNNLGEPSIEVFNSNPDAIVHINILSRSTQLSLSVLNNDGIVEKIFDNNHFTSKKSLHCLSSFFATLNEEEHILSDKFTKNDISGRRQFMVEIESILSCCFNAKSVIISTQLEYIKKYILLYLIYIKGILSVDWPRDLVSYSKDLKVGYTISIEKIILDNLIGTIEDFEALIYSSELVPKNDRFKNLIVITNGEGVLPAIQKCLAQDFPLKSYFLLAHLHEDYVQLTLNQVVISVGIDEREQESVICQDEIIPIRNLYESLCSNMLQNLKEDGSLIQLCDKHHENKDNVIMQLLAQKSKIDFMTNLTRFIRNNILAKDSNIKISDGSDINLNRFCNCKVYLTVRDLIEVSFKPVLKEIATIVSASLINNELFGKYIFIEYALTLIHFNENPVFQSVLQKILQENAQDFNEYQGIETKCLVIPEVANQLLQPVVKQRAFLYQGFQMGLLRQVYCRSCCFSLSTESCPGLEPLYKNKLTDLQYQSFTKESLFRFFEKGDIISNAEVKKIMYFKMKENSGTYELGINYHECEPSEDNEAIALKYDFSDNIGFLQVSFNAEDYSSDGHLPVVVSFTHHSYSSSINFSVSQVGIDIQRKYVFEIGEPMTLFRF